MIAYLDEYHCCDPSLFSPDPRIVEVGCFEPVKRLPLRLRYRARLHFVEASPANFKILCARIPPGADDVVTFNAALAEQDGPVTLYEYDHEQLSTLFPRHLQEGVKLQRAVSVDGYKLWTLLDKLGVSTCDLLLLNCEGAELFAMNQLAATPVLRQRVKQLCTSNHCQHIRCYPPKYWDTAVEALRQWYDVRLYEPVPNIPYALFMRRA